MIEKRKPIPVEEAIDKVMTYRLGSAVETVTIINSDGRRLGEDIKAAHPVPPFHKSPYDGFALKAEDTVGASSKKPVTFEVVDQIGAGSRLQKPLEKGQAVRIMTGAEIPAEADCVAMFEICQSFHDNGKEYMTLKREMIAGQNIIEKGSETSEGEILVKKGSRINPGVKALLATFGYANVKVVKKPVVGVFATGSELLDVDQPLEPGKIRNSNAYMIASQIERAGGIVAYFGKLKDDLEESYQAVNAAMDQVDMLITTGGVSVGDFDLLPDVYDRMGAEVLFNKIAMRPGSVTTVAVKNGKLLFGLSGNPSACYVGFELFTRPIIHSYLHTDKPFARRVKAVLGSDFPKPNPFTRFVRSRLDYEDGKLTVHPVGIDKSAVVTSLAMTNALMILPGGTRGYRQGQQVEALLLEDLEGQASF